MPRVVPAFVALVTLLASPVAALERCPVSGADLDGIVAAIEKASCAKAFAIMEACAFGSSADVQSGAAVVSVCQRALSPAARRTFSRESQACVEKYARQEGTMYRSMAAFCSAEAAVKAAAKSKR